MDFIKRILQNDKCALIIKCVLFVCCIFFICALCSCEEFNRDVKTTMSSYTGLNRTVTLMNMQGDTIKQWHGRLLITGDSSAGYLFDYNGKRVIISGGIITIEEW